MLGLVAELAEINLFVKIIEDTFIPELYSSIHNYNTF